MKITLTVLATLTALLTASIAFAEHSEDVRVSERCDRYDCTITITGPDNSCVRAARKMRFEGNGAIEAAVYIRNCMDRVVLARSGK